MQQCWHTFLLSYTAWKQQQERAERQTCKEGGKSGREGKEQIRKAGWFSVSCRGPRYAHKWLLSNETVVLEDVAAKIRRKGASVPEEISHFVR